MKPIRRDEQLALRRFRLVLILLTAALCLLAALILLPGQILTLRQEGCDAVERAVLRSAGQCYAVEGVYPPELSYLEEHYGLTVNHNTYVVTYEAFSSNLPPVVRVLRRGRS